MFNQAYHAHPLGGHVLANLVSTADSALGGGVAGRLDPLAGLLGGFGESAAERWLFTCAGLAPPLVGFAVGPAGGRLLVPLLAAAGASLWGAGLWRLLASASPLQTLVLDNGLLLQWPMLALVGAGLRSAWREAACEPLRLGLVSGLLFALLAARRGRHRGGEEGQGGLPAGPAGGQPAGRARARPGLSPGGPLARATPLRGPRRLPLRPLSRHRFDFARLRLAARRPACDPTSLACGSLRAVRLAIRLRSPAARCAPSG
ncbi:MAG: hypothetical protein QNK04_27980, partial [Myxococcota bacterium]|nr:hypothetical protein [Myxococcota bacterium]